MDAGLSSSSDHGHDDVNGNLPEVEEPGKDNLEGAACSVVESVRENERNDGCHESREIHPDVIVHCNEAEMESSGFGDQLNNNYSWNADNPLSSPQPFMRPRLSLAEMWRYPSVHHTVVAYPIFTPHPHQLSKIRQQNEKLRQELQKEPEKHRLSEERPSKKSHASTNTSIGNRRETNTAHPIRPSNIKPSSFNPENQKNEVGPTSTSDPAGGVVRNSVRNSRGYSKQGSVLLGSRESQLTKGSNSPNPILGAIRVQNEDVEYHKTQAKFARWHRKCWKSFSDCVTSEKCNCVSFVLLIVVVLCLCIMAILFPILKVLVGS